MQNKKTFNYTYSAKEQAEIKKIRNKYSAKEEAMDKLSYLRRLDASVTQKASAASIALGVVGALILGFGMSVIMSEFGAVFKEMALPIGIIAGVLGIIVVISAYPIYNVIVKKQREKIAPEILRLTDELMK